MILIAKCPVVVLKEPFIDYRLFKIKDKLVN